MSMNKYMHPRNIYKKPPDFKRMALDYPEFKKVVRMDVAGKVAIDFKDLESLRALSRTLLKKDFDLDVDMPINKLVPTIPLRLNYVLWIEDVLNVVETAEPREIRGIDVGTGASCVYALLSAKKNNWHMTATEADSDSFEFAAKNVSANNLQNLVEVAKVDGENLLLDVAKDREYDFCMCNPPFFASTQELHPFFNLRKSTRPIPKNAFCASVNEVVSKGGEVEFVSKLIKESAILKDKIKVYTTMIGHKCNVPPLKKLLRQSEVRSFKESYFCQGNTTRWGLAWSFSPSIDLQKAPDAFDSKSEPAKSKSRPLSYVLDSNAANESVLCCVSDKLLKLFKELDFATDEVSRNKRCLRYFVTAFSDTWSKQRRRRREKLRLGGSSVDSNSNLTGTEEAEAVCSAKRSREEDFDGSFRKKLRLSTDSEGSSVFLKFVASVKLVREEEAEKIVLELGLKEEAGDRQQLHQILQYVKNNLTVTV